MHYSLLACFTFFISSFHNHRSHLFSAADQVPDSFFFSNVEKRRKKEKKTRGCYKPLAGHSGEAEVERCGRSRDGRGRVEEGARTMDILLLSSLHVFG